MRLRITFAKQGALRYTGQIDLHRIWERSARRADLPLAYSHGYHPQPKIQLAAALPLGFSSRCEVVDLRWNMRYRSTACRTDPVRHATGVDDLGPSSRIKALRRWGLIDPPNAK
jgi:radical SAM-linked protein